MNEQEAEYVAKISEAAGLDVADVQDALAKLNTATQTTTENMNNLRYALQGEDNPYQKTILFALNKLQKHIYMGTVDERARAKRRKRGKMQRESRIRNRNMA